MAHADANIYAELQWAWAERMRLLAAGDKGEASGVWGAAFRRHFGDAPDMIEWRNTPEGGTDCIVAGVMYFEATFRADGVAIVKP